MAACEFFVVGGTLFIGREIVRRLVTSGHDVTVLHRRDRHDLGPEVQNLQADRSDLAFDRHSFMGNLYFGEFLDTPVHTSSIEKVQRMLSVTPTRLDDALAAGFAWYQGQPRREIDYTFEDRRLASGA